MKNKLIITLILCATLFNAAYAGNSATFAVSCSIPAVPGLNAPPFEKTAGTNEVKLDDTLAQKPQDTAEVVAQVEQKEVVLADGRNYAANVETIYAR